MSAIYRRQNVWRPVEKLRRQAAHCGADHCRSRTCCTPLSAAGPENHTCFLECALDIEKRRWHVVGPAAALCGETGEVVISSPLPCWRLSVFITTNALLRRRRRIPCRQDIGGSSARPYRRGYGHQRGLPCGEGRGYLLNKHSSAAWGVMRRTHAGR